MKILSIETSCDETAVAVVEFSEKESFSEIDILGERLYSQSSLHAEYGGVYPSVAKREHKKILPSMAANLLSSLDMLKEVESYSINEDVLKLHEKDEEMLEQIKKLFGNKEIHKIDAIAVTNGPGLSPALWVGVNFAKTLSFLYNIPIIPVNHMEGHIFSALIADPKKLEKPEYPILSLLVSGGHTELVLSTKEGEYKKIGCTLDDASGEAFDKVARSLGLPYPGGVEISKLSDIAREKGIPSPVTLPRPMLKSKDLNFSYSGLKTAVRIFLEKNPSLSEEEKIGLAMEFENAVVETLIEKTTRAIDEFNPKTLVVGGGVSANKYLRENILNLKSKYPEIDIHLSNLKYSTDNAIMIALAGYFNRDKVCDTSSLSADSNLCFPA